LRRTDPAGQLAGGHFLDAGCGTGQNLRWLTETLKPASLVGFDRSPRAVEIASRNVPEAHVYEDDLCDPDPPGGSYDLILCSDVLYATGTAPAISGLRLLCERLRSGGLFLLHLPAFSWLYSRHDVAVHTKHRFRKAEVDSLLHELGLTIELNTYRMCLLFPLVVVSRLPSLLFRIHTSSAAEVRSDLRLPVAPLNVLLRTVVTVENRAIGRGMQFPWGSSLVAVGRKM
jgi:SAM-dependent methyltransferase